MTDRPRTSAHRSVVVLSSFALGWAIGGVSGLSERPTWWTWPALAASALCSALLIRRAPTDLAGERSWAHRPPQAFARVVIGEVVAIAVMVAALLALDAAAFVPAAVALIVGVHFLALASALDEGRYRRTGIGICLVALAAMGTAAIDGPASQAVAGLGVALVLWATAWAVGSVDGR